MKRFPEQVTAEDELIALFLSGKPGKKMWFTRKMRDLPEDKQEKIWQLLEQRGFSRPTDKPIRGTGGDPRITWTDEEWESLSNFVWFERQRTPDDHLLQIAKRAQERFPANRQRNIRALNDLKPLIERLRQKDLLILDRAHDADRLKDDISRLNGEIEGLKKEIKAIPTRDEVLQTLTDEEVKTSFQNRVLDLVPPDQILKGYRPETMMSYVPEKDMLLHLVSTIFDTATERHNQLLGVIRELTEAVKGKNNGQPKPQPQPPARQTMPTPRVALKKVTVIGLLPDQMNVVQEKLKGRANFNFVDKNRKSDAIPENQDVIVLMANFISHSMQDQAIKKAQGTECKVVVHHGGISAVVKKLDSLLPQLEFAA